MTIPTQQRYEYLLFDIDNTLMDFNAGEKIALFQTMEEFGAPIQDEDYRAYLTINQAQWTKFEQGLLDSKAVQRMRFEEFAAHLNRDRAEGDALNARYVENLGRQAILMEGAMDLILQLRERYKIAVVTNGLTLVQRERLKRSSFLPHLDGVFISQEMGVQKPSAAYFDYVLRELNGADRTKCLMIGDSLSADILGGINAGIDTCWLRPAGAAPRADVSPTYTVDTYAELLGLLLP